MLAGQLNWSSVQSRPDMSYHAGTGSTKVIYAIIIDMKNANKAIRKLKSSEVTLKFHNLDDLEKPLVVCCSDSAFASLKNGGYQGAIIIFLYGNNKYGPIAWTSKKLKRVGKRTLSTETPALEESLETCFMIKFLLVELIGKDNYQNIIPFCCYTDNKSLVVKIISNKTLFEKRLQLDICIIREINEKQEVNQIVWCNSRSYQGRHFVQLIHIFQGDGKLL